MWRKGYVMKIKNGDLIQVEVVPLGYCLVRVTMENGNKGHIESTEKRAIPFSYGHFYTWYYEPLTAKMEEKC